ncbi:MAG: hypothetical protein OWQ49_02550 [Aquificaceae bacterium]|nr:hypothetical protein [Aquificaceae bacterium]
MFYVSKVSIPFFFLAVLDLIYSLFLRTFTVDVKSLWAVAVFGFVAHTIMGAMYQIVPNSQNRPLKLPLLSYVVFALSLASSVAFYSSNHLIGSFLHLVSCLIFFFHVLSSMRNFQPITLKFLTLGSLYFLLSGIFLVLSELGYIPFALAVHTLTVGFMLKVVVGVELAWIPMLYMEPLNLTLSKRLFYLGLFTTPPFLISFYLYSYKLIALMSFLVLAFVGYYLYLIYSLFVKRRTPKEIPYVIKYLLLALFILPFGLLIGSFMAGKELVSHMVFLHFDLLIYGFTAITIMGGMSHLYPRIVYNMKFSKKEGVYISDLVDEKAIKRILPLTVVALAWMVFAEAQGRPLSYLATIPYLILWLYFSYAVLIRGLLFRPKLSS